MNLALAMRCIPPTPCRVKGISLRGRGILEGIPVESPSARAVYGSFRIIVQITVKVHDNNIVRVRGRVTDHST